MRDTCQRKRAQMNTRKYQRSNRNWNTGTLTSACHQPASDKLVDPLAAADPAAQVLASTARYSRIGMPAA